VDLLEEVTRIFGGERQEVLARLATAIRSRDENALERGSLQLGSTLSSLSAATAADVAKRLATMRLEGDLGEVELVFQELESKVAQVERELVALVQSGPSLAVLAQRKNDGERR
jgi:HPt (histidine-containing phosphotransfer) domain-containing protein